MDQLVTMYLSDRLLRDELAPDSVPVIRSTLRRWLAWVKQPPPQWASEDVIRWIAQPQLRPNTRKSMLTKLRPFCHWLMDHGYLRADPTRGIRARAPEQGDPRDLDREDITKLLLAVPDQRGELIVVLMAQLGLRSGDLARIQMGDIDMRRKNLHVRAKGGRGGYTHWVPIPTEAWDLVARWIAGHGHRAGPLLRSYNAPHGALRGKSIGHLVGSWMAAAGLKAFPYDGVSGHALRHSCAQHMLDGGAELREVQWQMGHKSSKTTEIYLRRDPPGLRAAAEGRAYRTS